MYRMAVYPYWTTLKGKNEASKAPVGRRTSQNDANHFVNSCVGWKDPGFRLKVHIRDKMVGSCEPEPVFYAMINVRSISYQGSKDVSVLV